MNKTTTGGLATPGAAAAAPPATWFIEASRLVCVDQQETNLTGGDEVYVATIRFRTRLGVPNTTSTAFVGGLIDMPSVNTGDAPFIGTMGRAAFANVTRLGLAEITAGQNPEVVGSAVVAVESDLSPNGLVNNLFTEAAADMKPLIAAAAEDLTLGDLGGEGLGEVLGPLVEDIEKAVDPTLGEKLALFVRSVGDADDVIGKKLNIFVAVDDALAPIVDAQIGDALDPSVGVVGALRTRSYTQRYAGRKAIYDINFSVRK